MKRVKGMEAVRRGFTKRLFNQTALVGPHAHALKEALEEGDFLDPLVKGRLRNHFQPEVRTRGESTSRVVEKIEGSS